MDSEKLKRNLTSSKHWLRLLFMVLLFVILGVASIVVVAVIVLQFLFALITGQDNLNLRRFGQSLAQYFYQALGFLTYSRDDKPFPFDEWPSEEQTAAPAPVVTPGPRAAEAKSTEVKSTGTKKAATNTAVSQKAASKSGVNNSEVNNGEVNKSAVTKSGVATKAATKTQAEQPPLPEDTPDEPTETPNI